ncbi:MAG: potassium channel family protein [Christensenellales bacterium]|jgi:trk system potassium uptake protein TrkA
MMKKQVLVVGLGRFGTSLAKTLSMLGCQVMAIDSRQENVEALADSVTQALQMDASDEQAFKQIGAGNFDVAVVATGGDQNASVIVTLMCKEVGIPLVVAKANSELHAKILYKIGADKVVFPERDMGVRVARTLFSQSVLDLIELTDDYSIIEIRAPKSWVGKSLIDLDLRSRFNLNVVAIKTKEDVFTVPGGTDVFQEGDVVVLIGNTRSIERVEKMG